MKAEEYIQDHTRRCSNELVSVESIDGKEVRSYYPWMTVEGALEAVRIAREELSHSEVTKTCPRYDQEAVSDDLEKAAIDYGNRTAWTDDDPFNWILEIAFKDGANWQKEQIAARDKTLDYYTFENGEKRFAKYILEMISNGWHINAIKTACNDKIKEG